MHSAIGFRSASMPPSIVLFVSAFMLLAGIMASWSDELTAWYRSDSRSAGYAAVRNDLGRIFSEAGQKHIPQRLLAERLREGASKKVPADRMMSALRADLARFERARFILSRAGIGGTFLSNPPEGMVKEVGIYLQAGLPDQLIGQLLAAGAGMRGGRELALAACGAIMDLRAISPIQDADSLQIGRLLMTSGMRPSGYASLALIYGLGRSRGLSHDRLVHDVIINTLSTGGGLAIMNHKIESTPIAEPLSPARPAAKAHAPRSPAGRPTRQR